MTGITTGNTSNLRRGSLYSADLKKVLYDETLIGQKYVEWMTEFPDGDTFYMPSVGELDAYDYAENEPIQYQALDTGIFSFTINQYKQSGTFITKKAKQDSFWLKRVESQFVPMQARAIMRDLEANIWKEGQPKTGGDGNYQTAGALNTIFGQAHRWVGSDTGLAGVRVLAPEDFARASLALDKANVPQRSRVMVVPPEMAYIWNTQTNLVNFSQPHPLYESVIQNGVASDMRFFRSIFGFDVYLSNFLPLCGTDQTGVSETIDGVASGTNAKACVFFSAEPSLLPFIGAWRQSPEVDIEYNKDLQRDEYLTTCRYGLKAQRPENFGTILVGTTVV
jgi:hypothetical protein